LVHAVDLSRVIVTMFDVKRDLQILEYNPINESTYLGKDELK